MLDGLSLDLPRGKTTVVLGPSGCGKSVMLKHLVGLLRPDAGEVWFEDMRVDQMRERELGQVRLQIGFLFQMSALFDSMTVEENVAFPLVEHARLTVAERRERITEALGMVDLLGVEKRLPAQLSGGQRKRVAMARAIVLEPRLMLYDEPTTGLDPIRADGINELVIRLQHRLGVTGLLVTHDLSSAKRVADDVILLLHGKIAARGTYEQLEQSEDPEVRRFLAGRYAHEDEAEATPPIPSIIQEDTLP